MTEKTLKEKMAKFLKLKAEKEKIENEMEKIKKSVEAYLKETGKTAIEMPYKEKVLKAQMVFQTRKDIDKKALQKYYAEIYNKLLVEKSIQFIKIQAVKGR